VRFALEAAHRGLLSKRGLSYRKFDEAGMRHVCALAIGLFAAAGTANAAEIKIFTARAGATVLEKIAPEFQRRTGHKLDAISEPPR
jgi:hypothetical protein